VCLLLQDLPPSNFPDGQQTVRVFHTISLPPGGMSSVPGSSARRRGF
jgi:hypothetical protein